MARTDSPGGAQGGDHRRGAPTRPEGPSPKEPDHDDIDQDDIDQVDTAAGQSSDRVRRDGADPFFAHRLEAFSDGVMAVIITITAFGLRPPNGFGAAAVRHEVPHLLVYMLSFIYIGIYWNNHHHLLRRTPRINGQVMWANLHLLFWLSLVPVLTEWIGSEYRHALPAACYGLAVLGAAIAYWILVHAIIRTDEPGSQLATAIGSDVKGVASAVLYCVGIGLAFASPWAAYAVYVLVALMWLVPDRRLVR